MTLPSQPPSDAALPGQGVPDASVPPVILVAPDSFTGTMTAARAAAAMAIGVQAALPTAIVRSLPFADGGEGTVDAVVAAGAERRSANVSGPLGEHVAAEWAMLGDTAVIEMAQASGLLLLPALTPETAVNADTAGTGELILAALDAGARRIIVGIGGSATTDGGMGALRVLGVRFLDAGGAEVTGGGASLHRVASVDVAGIDSRLATVPLVLCTDVAAPFFGPGGAAQVFGPQKGADERAVSALDAGLEHLAGALHAATGIDLATLGWGGAGGGIAGGLHAALGASAADGVAVLADLVQLERRLDGVGLVLVGEGSLDGQSVLGKAPVGLAKRAQARGIPVIAVVGRTDLAPTALAEQGIGWIVAASQVAPSIDEAMAHPDHWVAEAARLALGGVPAEPSSIPVVPTEYFHFLRTPRMRWWRPLLALLAWGVGFLIIQVIVAFAGIGADLATGVTTLDDLQRDALNGTLRITPNLFLANNLGLVALIPMSLLLQWAFLRQRPRWLSSVRGGFRWRWFGLTALVVVPIWIVYVGGTFLVDPGDTSIHFTGTTLFLLLTVILTTPLQAAGEEYSFRGFITRAVAAWIPIRIVAFIVGTAVSTTFFVLAHGASDGWLILTYALFGITLSVLAWRTGGLEAGIMVHAVNNTLALLPTVLFGNINTVFQRGSGTGNPSDLIGIAAMVVASVILIAILRRRRMPIVGPPETDAAA